MFISVSPISLRVSQKATQSDAVILKSATVALRGSDVGVVRRARAAAELERLPEPPSRDHFRPYSVNLVPSSARAHQV